MKKNILFTIILLSLSVFTGCAEKNYKLPQEVLVEYSGGNFYVMQYEVTINEYLVYCKETWQKYDTEKYEDDESKLKYYIIDDNSSVIGINAVKCAKYANWLSKKAGLKPAYKITKDKYKHEVINFDKTADGYRMPTPEEWLWAAKGGNKSKGYKYPGSDNSEEVGWSDSNSDNKVHAPGLKKPNELDIYDMYGNAAEWCWKETIHFTPNIKIYEDPSSEWEELADFFYKNKPDGEWDYIYEKLDNIKDAGIKVDDNYWYDNYFLAVVGSAFVAKTGYNSFSNMCFPAWYMNGDYKGIRLVHNAVK